MLVCMLALLLKVLVPTGYMIGTDHGRITVGVCSAMGPRTMTIEVPGLHGNLPEQGSDQGKAEMPCAFSSLSAAVLGAIDPIQLGALLAFVMAMGFVTVAALPRPEPPFLRPPLRGPPLTL